MNLESVPAAIAPAVWGLGFGGLGFEVSGSVFGVWGLESVVWGLVSDVWCCGFKVANSQTRPCRAVVNLVVTKVATKSETQVVEEHSHTTSSARDRGAGRQSRSCGCSVVVLS